MKFWKKVTRFRSYPALTSLDLTAASLPEWKPPLIRMGEPILRRGRRRILLLVLWSFGAGVVFPKALGYAVLIVYSLVRTHGLSLPLRTHAFSIILYVASAVFILVDVIGLARESRFSCYVLPSIFELRPNRQKNKWFTLRSPPEMRRSV